MVVVKWSACLPSIPTIWVRIPLKPTVNSVKFVFEKRKNEKKRPGWPIFLKKMSFTPPKFNVQKVRDFVFDREHDFERMNLEFYT